MKLSQGVEWALHTCLNLSWVDPDQSMTTAKLAAFYQLPAPYMNKQLQALTRAGILLSTAGPRGGFRLARPIERISLLDVVVAIEGGSDLFQCDQILKDGPGGSDRIDYRATCVISGAMQRAELAWRRSLAEQSLADIRVEVERQYPRTAGATVSHFMNVG